MNPATMIVGMGVLSALAFQELSRVQQNKTEEYIPAMTFEEREDLMKLQLQAIETHRKVNPAYDAYIDTFREDEKIKDLQYQLDREPKGQTHRIAYLQDQIREQNIRKQEKVRERHEAIGTRGGKDLLSSGREKRFLNWKLDRAKNSQERLQIKKELKALK